MSTLGVSRSGRVRKKSAKVVEMETFDSSGGDERLQSSQNNHADYSSGNESTSRVSSTSASVPIKKVLTNNKNLTSHSVPQVARLPGDTLDGQMSDEFSSSSSSESESDDDSSDNDSEDSEDLPLRKVSAQQMAQLAALQKGRRPKQSTPQRNRQYSSSTDYDPPYNPKTGAARLSTNPPSVHKGGPQRRPQSIDNQTTNNLAGVSDDDLSSSSDFDDSDDDSDSGGSLIIEAGDGMLKKAPIRKLKLPIATATALVNAQRQKVRQMNQQNNDDDLTDDKNDDDFLPSSAKRRRPSANATPAPVKKVEKKTESQEPKKPKAPSAYVMYCTETRKKLLAQNPSLTFSELSKRMGQMWNMLPEKDKQCWKKKAKLRQTKNANLMMSMGKTNGPPSKLPNNPVQKGAAKNNHNTCQKSPVNKSVQQPAKGTGTIQNVERKPVQTKATLSKASSTPNKPASKKSPVSSNTISNHLNNNQAAATAAKSATKNGRTEPKPTSNAPSNLSALISNCQELLEKPIEAPPRPFGHGPLDAAAHLKLLGESLTTIGTNLMDHDRPIAVSGSLSVLLDSTLCALGPLVCLTAQLDELNGSQPETLKRILNNIAYIMPGL